jgi:putative ABC transport system permease protein
LAVGIAIAGGLLDLVKRFGLDVPDSGTVVLGRTIAVAIGVGLAMTVGSAVFPAVRASRTPPVAAIQDVARTAPLSGRRRGAVGGVVLVLGLGTLTIGMIADPTTVFLRVAVIGVGAVGAFLGVVILLAVFARPLAQVAGWPVVRVLATPGLLARRNATRNPRRTAATASALVVGLSLVCLVAIFASSTKASLRDAVYNGVRADFVLTNEQLGPLSSDVADRVAELPDVAAASGVRLGQIAVGDSTEFVAGVDAAALDELIALDLEEGSERGLADGAILVQEREASDHDASVGEPITVTFPGAGVVSVPVVGIYEQPNFIGGFPVPTFVLDREAFETQYGGTQRDSLVYVKARPGQVDAAERQIEDALEGDFPNIRVQTRSEFADRQQDTVDQFVAVLVALLLLSELIAILGIVNTLYLSVYERTRELGLLRVVGMSRRQVQTMVRGESVIMAIIGGAVGLVVGVFWGWAFTTALAREGITEFAVPFVQLGMFLLLSVVAGVVAALLPAWRASRLDVLEAVATE